MVFLELQWEPRGHSQVTVGMDIENSFFAQGHQDLCLVRREPSGISSRLGRAIRVLLHERQETEGPFLLATVILGFLSVFNKSQALSPLGALNGFCLSRCQRDVRPAVQMRRGPRAFSRVSPGDSATPSSRGMKASVHSSHCREIQPSFESGHLSVHSI